MPYTTLPRQAPVRPVQQGYPGDEENTAPRESFASFLKRIGASGVDVNNNPVGSTGGLVPMGQSDSETWQSLNRAQTGGGNEVSKENDLGRLNEILGVSLGPPNGNAAMRAAHESMSPMRQMVGGLERMKEQQRANEIARLMRETGGLPQVGMDRRTFDGRMAAARAFIDRPESAASNVFMPKPRDAYMGDGPDTTNWRNDVIAANGAPVAGYAGNLASAITRADGSHAFTLKQAPKPIPPGIAALARDPNTGQPMSNPMEGNSFLNPGGLASGNSFLKPVARPLPNGEGMDLMPGIEQLRARAGQAREGTPLPQGNRFMPAPVTTPAQSNYDRYAAEYRAGTDAVLNPAESRPEILDMGDGIRVLKAGKGYQQLRQKNDAEFKDGHVYDVAGRKAVFKSGRFIDTDTGAPLYTQDAFGEQKPNPIVFGQRNAAPASAEKPAASYVVGKTYRDAAGRLAKWDGAKFVAVSK